MVTRDAIYQWACNYGDKNVTDNLSELLCNIKMQSVIDMDVNELRAMIKRVFADGLKGFGPMSMDDMLTAISEASKAFDDSPEDIINTIGVPWMPGRMGRDLLEYANMDTDFITNLIMAEVRDAISTQIKQDIIYDSRFGEIPYEFDNEQGVFRFKFQGITFEHKLHLLPLSEGGPIPEDVQKRIEEVLAK